MSARAPAFTLADRQLCERISAKFYAEARGGGAESWANLTGRSWANLAARIQRALVGEYTTFTRDDCRLIQSLHLAVLKEPLADGAAEMSRALSRLGVLVLQATRGQLPPIQSGAR